MNMKADLISGNQSFFVNYPSPFHCEGQIDWQMRNDSNSVALSGLEGSLNREIQ